MKSIRDGNTHVDINAAVKDKKISIEKALRAASKKVVMEWPSYLYSHIKEIRKGYNKSNKFRNSQIKEIIFKFTKTNLNLSHIR